MNVLKKTIIILVAFCAVPFLASAQRFSIGSNAVDWLSLGTLNIDGSAAVSQHFSVHVGAECNPWTFKAGDAEKQFEMRHASYWAGARWWPWYTYSGWWAGANARYSVYNIGGLFSRDTEEGFAYGGGLYGGYSIMITTWLNLDLGIGVWGGYKKYTRYSCPLCGVTTEKGEGPFVLPDARVAIQFVF